MYCWHCSCPLFALYGESLIGRCLPVFEGTGKGAEGGIYALTGSSPSELKQVFGEKQYASISQLLPLNKL